MRTDFALLLSVLLAGTVAAGERTVVLKRTADTIEVQIGEETFAVYNFGKKLPKPYFTPVRGPGGTVLTRRIFTDRKSGDHPHHKGIWVAVDEVNEVKFWAERGKIRTIDVDIQVAKGNPARFAMANFWLPPDGAEPVVIEKTTISIFPNRLMAFDIRFHASGRDVTFRDTKEGLFGFRMVESMRERDGGKVVNADGLKGTSACWGVTSPWVDYYGPVEGKTFGVALFDHPQNFRKSRYHVRNYGLFSISPFGEKAYTRGKQPAKPVTIKAGGEPLRLRYGIYIHEGDTKHARVAQVYRTFVKAGGK